MNISITRYNYRHMITILGIREEAYAIKRFNSHSMIHYSNYNMTYCRIGHLHRDSAPSHHLYHCSSSGECGGELAGYAGPRSVGRNLFRVRIKKAKRYTSYSVVFQRHGMSLIIRLTLNSITEFYFRILILNLLHLRDYCFIWKFFVHLYRYL